MMVCGLLRVGTLKSLGMWEQNCKKQLKANAKHKRVLLSSPFLAGCSDGEKEISHTTQCKQRVMKGYLY